MSDLPIEGRDESAQVDSRLRGVVRLPPESSRVTDADEEVFLLYTTLAGRTTTDGSSGFRGLGHIDSHEDVLTISLKYRLNGSPIVPAPSHAGKRKKTSDTKGSKGQRARTDTVETLEVEIQQDKTALRSRKGDTGSVLWHASVDFAEKMLQQLHEGQPSGFLDPALLAQAHVLELGAGTGLLGVVLSPFTRHYTVTDIAELIPLIRKNIARNRSLSPTSAPSTSLPRSKRSAPPPSRPLNVTASALDWVQLHKSPTSLRPNLVPEDPVDLLLVVDCIYHPSLLPALLTTLDYLTVPGKTAVVVVVELRAEDVIREFIQGWLDKSPHGEWEIRSVSGLLDGPYAVWVGWKAAVRALGERAHQ